MIYPCKTVVLVAFVALISSGPAFTQSPTTEEENSNTAAVAPVAYVYVQTTKGIDVLSASSTGRLTQVKGSLFADTGEMGAVNGSYLVSVGTDYLHTYPIEANGAVGKQVSEINTQNYGGSQCGTNLGGALFDHTGKYLNVFVAGGSMGCGALQTYKIGPRGDLTFLGDSVDDNGGYHGLVPSGADVSVVSGNNKFAYGLIGYEFSNSIAGLTREANGGLMEFSSSAASYPAAKPSSTGDGYYPGAMAADLTNHLAVVLYTVFNDGTSPPQLASFTINNATGYIASTNTWENMPAPAIDPGAIAMSPTGKQLAVASTGIEIYNFNGAAPLTLAASLPLPGREFGYVAWDKNNHLYALDSQTGNLYVYSVNSKSITAAPGSPYAIPDNTPSDRQYESYQYGLIVVPKL